MSTFTARSLATAAVVFATLAVGTHTASAATEPELKVSRDTLSGALHCHGSLTSNENAPVLFIHGTASDATSDWSWNWNRAFDQRGWSYCNVELPDYATADIQVSAEYVVSALRTMSASAGRKVDIVGHSQGGMVGRWALKYWPSTRGMVDDYVGLASSNHGSTTIKSNNCADACNAASWQQSEGSAFITTLNDGGETFPGIDYSNIATTLDEIVTPYSSTFLAPGPNVTNLAVQQLCPLDPAEHFAMSADNAAWLVGLDALQNPGPSDPSRFDPSTCAQVLMPGVDVNALAGNVSAALTLSFSLDSTQLTEEPPLAEYATS